MNVRDLIETLQQYDPNANILVKEEVDNSEYDNDFELHDIEIADISKEKENVLITIKV